jgi:predicted nucleic acid-binding protein
VAQYFFDTSALVKRYHGEDGTEQVSDIFAPAESVVRISTLGVVEIHSALAIKVRSGQLTRAAAQILTDGVLADIASGRIKPHSVTDRHFADAERMVRQFSYDHRLRSLDAIQLSVALDLRSQGLADSIVTADRAVQEVANLVGLAVFNPQDRG